MLQYQYCVVEIYSFPFDNICKYVCVPHKWVLWQEENSLKVVIVYPEEEPSRTQFRIRNYEEYSKSWKQYLGYLKCTSKSYYDAMNILEYQKKKGLYGMEPRTTKNPETCSCSLEKSLHRSQQNSSSCSRMKEPVVSAVPIYNSRSADKTGVKRSAPADFYKEATMQTSRSKEQVEDMIHSANGANVIIISDDDDTGVNKPYAESLMQTFSKQADPLIDEEQFLSNELETLFTEMQSYQERSTALINDLQSKCNQAAAKCNRLTDLWNAHRSWKNNTINTVPSKDWLELFSKSIAENIFKQIENQLREVKEQEQGNLPKENGSNKFTLPPEYNRFDSNWTLKYPEYKPGLVELMHSSGIFVDPNKLAYCLQQAQDCKSLARMLMLEVFSENALKVCSLTGARSATGCPKVRPGLDERARETLIAYVEIFGRKKRWPKCGKETIKTCMRNKLMNIRYRHDRFIQ